MSLNRFQLTQNRDQLIQNLEQHLDKLREQRAKLLPSTSTTAYGGSREIIQLEHPMTKYQLQQTINQNKVKLQQLQKQYLLKKQFQTQSSILPALKRTSIPTQQQLTKKKIISEQLKKAQLYLQQQKKTRKQVQKEQRELYESIIEREKGVSVSSKLGAILKKQKISLVDEDFILTTVFESLKDLDSLVNKNKLRDYLGYNPKVAELFHIGKRELSGDLMVCETKRKGEMDYREFFEFVKSIQITYRSLNPSKGGSIKPKLVKESKVEESKEEVKISSYNKYLSELFSELDKESEKIVAREVLAKSICTSNMKLKKYYQKLDKALMREFQRRMQRIPKLAEGFYKQLSLQCLSRQELLNEFKQFYSLYQNPPNPTAISQSLTQSQPSPIPSQPSIPCSQPLEQSLLYLDKQQPDAPIQSTDYQSLIKKKQLQQFDAFFQRVAKQNKQQIYDQKTDHENIAAEFNKLQMYISYMDNKIHQ